MRLNLNEATKFLMDIWVVHPPNAYVFLSYKDKNGKWHDVPQRVSDPIKIPNQGRDVYFCPNAFRKPRRLEKYALSTPWLHADLDEVDPEDLDVLPPTTAWTTSPRRYQCLWRLTQPITPVAHGKLNQRLNYLVKADKGGWNVTKALRLPGTISRKRKDAFVVDLLWEEMQYYTPQVVLGKVRHVKVIKQVDAGDLKLPEQTADSIVHKYRGVLTKRARRLIRTPKAKIGERSDRLWELECLLLQAGLSPEETLVVVRETVWNKFAGTRRELPQLWGEIKKAQVHVKNHTGANGVQPKFTNKLRLVDYGDFLARPVPTELWTVEGIWSHQAHGLVAGEAKTFKSFTATDLGVSVASGTPFLGHFQVPKTGPVIIIQEENTVSMMKDRFEKVCGSRALLGHASVDNGKLRMELPEDLPISLMNNMGFDLTETEHLEFLEEQIIRLEPALVILDPLYLMIPGFDENSAKQITPVLRNLLALKQRYNVGILIVHHYNKPREDESRSPGNRISGTSVFYRWFESALYLEKGAEPGEVKMTPEHRGHAPGKSLHVFFDIGPMGEPDYYVDVEVRQDENKVTSRRRLQAMIEDAHPKGVTIKEVAEELGISESRVRTLAEKTGLKIRRSKPDGSPGRPPVRIYR